MFSSLVLLTSLIPALTLAAPTLHARAVTHPNILSMEPSGPGCLNSTAYERTISPDGWTSVVGYRYFIADDVAGPSSCTVVLRYEVVIPSDGKADLDLEITQTGATSGNADLPNDTLSRLSQVVSFDGKSLSSSTTMKADTRGNTRVNPKWTVTGAAGAKVAGSLSVKIDASISGGRPGENFADLQVENTSFNFLPRAG